MNATAYLLAPADPWQEATLMHPDGTRESIAETASARALGISLAVRGYRAPWPVKAGARHALQLLPELACPAWCPGTDSAHHIEADEHARAYLEHSLHLPTATEASVIVRQRDGWHPAWSGSPVLAVLGDDLDRADALALAETITTASRHLSPGVPPVDPAARAAVVSMQDYRA